mmetsp:Transcript_62769/g.172410  ORF Transcript_62769/g.172410 Transcript_62769/m.172410 type:complete len:388 (+) Transcript_62769:129-1292(+)
MPERIILVRHGEAEHNLDHSSLLLYDNPDRKPDNLSELTELGMGQAHRAGRHVRSVLGEGATVSVVVSPFERTQQTLYCMQQELDGVHLRCVHVDPRVREQEFGNFQQRDEMQFHRATASEVGRFWYRRPTGESGADVYDRASSFWDDLLAGAGTTSLDMRFEPIERRLRSTGEADDALLVVTHGLTMRLLLMRYFGWSPQTFDAVYNPGNANVWVLKKVAGCRRYALEPDDCLPRGLPWATRQIRVVMTGEHSSGDLSSGELSGEQNIGVGKAYTVLDYLSVPQPRTSHPELVLSSLLEGHDHRLDPSREAGPTPKERADFIAKVVAGGVKLDPNLVERMDWWCGKISAKGAELRTDIAAERTVRRVVLNSPTGRRVSKTEWTSSE